MKITLLDQNELNFISGGGLCKCISETFLSKPMNMENQIKCMQFCCDKGQTVIGTYDNEKFICGTDYNHMNVYVYQYAELLPRSNAVTLHQPSLCTK